MLSISPRLSLLAASLALTSVAAAQQPVNFQMRYDSHWSNSTHPGAYPAGAHYSPLIGGTHNGMVQFWQPGTLATNGIEVMAETGNPNPLRSEVQSAIAAGNAGEVIQGPGLNSPGVVNTTFTATDDFHYMTVVTMIAPSPDWFVGTQSLNLKPNGEWIHSVTVPLLAWDAGTDSGVDFNSGDADTVPAMPVALQTGGPFQGTTPLATITITRVSTPDETCNGDGGDQMGCTDCPCGNDAAQGTIGGCLNSAASSARLRCEGIASIFTDTLRFEMTGAPSNAFCVLNSGDSLAPQNMANPCFGSNSGVQSASFDGIRCAVGNTRRHGGRAANFIGEVGTNGPGWGPPDNPMLGISAQAGFVVGQTRFFQVVYRDNATLSCMRGLNTSQAIIATYGP